MDTQPSQALTSDSLMSLNQHITRNSHHNLRMVDSHTVAVSDSVSLVRVVGQR